MAVLFPFKVTIYHDNPSPLTSPLSSINTCEHYHYHHYHSEDIAAVIIIIINKFIYIHLILNLHELPLPWNKATLN